MTVRKLQVFLSITLVLGLAACKYQPNQIRSTLKTANVYQFLEEGSIAFARAGDRRSGTLKFNMTQMFKCGVVFWSEDLNEQPYADSPKTIPCPKDQKEVSLFFANLESGVPYSFKVMVWPEKLTAASSAYIILRERESLKDLDTQTLIVNRINAPRQSAEVYVYKMAEEKPLIEIRDQLTQLYSSSLGKCSSSPPKREFPFEKSTSQKEEGSTPLMGLEGLSSDGYAQGVAKVHKFFDDRLVLNMSSVDMNQNMTWSLNWQGRSHSFESYPPSQISDFRAKSDVDVNRIENRSLKNAAPKFSFGRNSPEFTFTTLYPGDVNYLHIHLRNPLSAKDSIYCVFRVSQTNYTIPNNVYQKLGKGTYELTAILESVLLHYKTGLPYPPWVMTYQDMIHSKFEKVL